MLQNLSRLWDSGLRFFAFWEQEGHKDQTFHISPKLKPITRKAKERERKAKENVSNRIFCGEYRACIRGNYMAEMYGMSGIPIC